MEMGVVLCARIDAAYGSGYAARALVKGFTFDFQIKITWKGIDSSSAPLLGKLSLKKLLSFLNKQWTYNNNGFFFFGELESNLFKRRWNSDTYKLYYKSTFFYKSPCG